VEGKDCTIYSDAPNPNIMSGRKGLYHL